MLVGVSESNVKDSEFRIRPSTSLKANQITHFNLSQFSSEIHLGTTKSSETLSIGLTVLAPAFLEFGLVLLSGILSFNRFRRGTTSRNRDVHTTAYYGHQIFDNGPQKCDNSSSSTTHLNFKHTKIFKEQSLYKKEGRA
jgi:hypothetical protein